MRAGRAGITKRKTDVPRQKHRKKKQSEQLQHSDTDALGIGDRDFSAGGEYGANDGLCLSIKSTQLEHDRNNNPPQDMNTERAVTPTYATADADSTSLDVLETRLSSVESTFAFVGMFTPDAGTLPHLMTYTYADGKTCDIP